MAISDWIISEEKPEWSEDSWVEMIAEIKNNETGEVRNYETTGIFNDDAEHPDTFIWEEGNFSCDCNRYLFFQRVNDDDEIDEDCSCGDERYSINLKNKKDDKIFYREFE